MDGCADCGGRLKGGVIDGVQTIGVVGKDSDHNVPDVNVIEGGETVVEDDAGRSGTSEVMPRKRLLRRWPSSADIGMVTDGH